MNMSTNRVCLFLGGYVQMYECHYMELFWLCLTISSY